MLPKSMYQEHLFRIPKFRRLKRSEIDFSNELKGFHQLFHGCFHRSESRKHFFRYMAGQLSHLEGKLKGDAATASNLGNTRSIQRFISDTEWDDQAIILKYRSILKEDMGCSHGVLIIDETDFVKKGYESIGVANQYCVRTGKVENSQVGVFAAYASSEGYCLLEKQLFLSFYDLLFSICPSTVNIGVH